MQFNQAPAPRESSLSDAYDPTASYSVDDLCIHDNVLYKCTTAISGGEMWNPEHWTETNVADEIKAVNSKFIIKQMNVPTMTIPSNGQSAIDISSLEPSPSQTYRPFGAFLAVPNEDTGYPVIIIGSPYYRAVDSKFFVRIHNVGDSGITFSGILCVLWIRIN